jgi:hypothetical protein
MKNTTALLSRLRKCHQGKQNRYNERSHFKMKLPPMRTSGIFGLARGQIAGINALHIGDPGIKPIELTMQFINMSGETVAQNTKTVHPMKAISFDYEFDASLEGNRQELRVLVGGRGPANPHKHIRITVEVFDKDTGKNSLFYVETPKVS